jgi:hypothetical protein
MRSLRSLTLLVGIAALSACEDSSAPVTVDVAYVATRFDALGRARADLGDPGGAFAARGAALALRLGVRPSPVSIAVDGVTEEYLALETEHAFGFTGADAPLPPPPLVVRMMVAWRGLLPDRFVTITVPGDTGTFGLLHALTSTEANSIFASDANSIFAPSFGILFDRGGPPWMAVAGGARATRESLGGECEVPRRETSFVPALEPVACNRASFFTRFAMTVNERNTITRALRSRLVDMGAHDVAGVRFLYRPLPTVCPVC